MKYSIFINCVLLQNLPFLMCISVFQVSRTLDNGVICETLGAIAPDTGFATVADINGKNETGEIRNESYEAVQRSSIEHPIHNSVNGNSNDISNSFKREVNKDASHGSNYVSGNQGKPNGTTKKPLTNIFSLLDSILNLHSGVEQTNVETNETHVESEMVPMNGILTNSSDLTGVWDDVFKVVTFKISRDSFSKLFFPDDSSTKSNVSDRYVSMANSEVKMEKTDHPKEIKKETTSRTKISKERLAKGKEDTVQSKFDKSDETKNYDQKNITDILKHMTKLITEHSERTRYHRLPTTTSSPLDMDDILKQMQLLIDMEMKPNSGSTLINLETPARREHKDMQTIINEMDKLLKAGELKSSKASSSSRTDLQSIVDQMEELIKEQKRSRHLRNRKRRSLKERNRKNHLTRLRLVLPKIGNGTLLTFEEPSEDLCTLPFIDVAYKVCILPVLDRQLSWHDAHQYCRHRGLELAMDSGVIKGRKYFNNELGLSGTRERWTLWVGGKKDDQGRWLWNDGTTLPNFFWSKNQPRVYGQDSTPAGTCMAIHGFSEYYGTALPCHNRRRFVCQKI